MSNFDSETESRYVNELSTIWSGLSRADKNYLLSYGYKLLECQKKEAERRKAEQEAAASRQVGYEIRIDHHAIEYLRRMTEQDD